MYYPVADLPSFLKGRWQLSRVIDNHLASAKMSFTGTAEWSAGNQARYWHYHEQGVLSSEEEQCPFGQGISGFRDYIYKISEDGRQAEIFFADRRFFHQLDLTAGFWCLSHDCPPDIYHGQFCVSDEQTLLIRWKASGPRKNLLIQTHLIRGS